MIDWIAERLHEDRESLDWPAAFALLQHYGLPSRMVDLTGDLGLAFAFAATGNSTIGRLAVVPYACRGTVQLVELFAHPWAERAQRQAAYGIVMTSETTDLKAETVRARLGIKWFEFEMLPSEKEFYKETYQDLLKESNDPSAGFLRYYITLYVEACRAAGFGKLSPDLTEWLLEKRGANRRIPIAPYCYLVDSVEDNEAVVYFRSADTLQPFNEDIEAEWSRRYWSSAYDDRSEERLELYLAPSPGLICFDPRTYHPDFY